MARRLHLDLVAADLAHQSRQVFGGRDDVTAANAGAAPDTRAASGARDEVVNSWSQHSLVARLVRLRVLHYVCLAIHD